MRTSHAGEILGTCCAARGELVEMTAQLDRAGVPILGNSDHTVSKSLCVEDPDGIESELYVDEDPAIWKADPQAVATVKPLAL